MGRDERGRASRAAMRGGWGAGAARRDGFPGLNGDGSQGGSPGRIHGTSRVSIRPARGPLASAEPGPRATGDGSQEPGTVAPSAVAPWGRLENLPWKGTAREHFSSPAPEHGCPRDGNRGRCLLSPCPVLGHRRAMRGHGPSMGAGSWVVSAPAVTGAARAGSAVGTPVPVGTRSPLAPHRRSLAGGRRHGRSGRRGCSGSVLFCRRGRLRRYSGAGGAGGVPASGPEDWRPFLSGTRLLQAQKGRAPRLPVEQRARRPRENRVPAWGDSPRENERLHFFFVRGEKLEKKKYKQAPLLPKLPSAVFHGGEEAKSKSGLNFSPRCPFNGQRDPPGPAAPGSLGG